MINENSSEGVDFVKCRLCGESMRHLANHIVKVHNITLEKYQEIFPEARIMSTDTFERRSEANKQRYAGYENHHYNKRKVYRMPDGSFASRTDTYMKAWGYDHVKPEDIVDASETDYVPSYAKLETFGTEGEDYVVCQCEGCNFKGSNIARHIREKHGMTVGEYQEKYNGAPTKSRKAEEALHNGALKKWQTQFASGKSIPSPRRDRKPRKEVVITDEMIEKGYKEGMTQHELAQSLDVSDVTLVKYQKEFGIETPLKCLTKIRKAVRAGAEVNLEMMTCDELENMLYENGLEGTMAKCGVNRYVIESWREKLKNPSVNESICDKPIVEHNEQIGENNNDDDDLTQIALF